MYDSSGSILKEVLPGQHLRYGSSEFGSNTDQNVFQKFHGANGDTCYGDLGGIIWKEYDGISILVKQY